MTCTGSAGVAATATGTNRHAIRKNKDRSAPRPTGKNQADIRKTFLEGRYYAMH